MANITYDGQSFIVDSRRLWLVSGNIDYARTPHQLWRDRIRSAKQAGLNCIETAVCWNVHEPQPGKFNFDGDADLKHFVHLVAEQGLKCILRPGPFVGEGYDMGALPAWLLETDDVQLRQASPAFLQSVARYFDAVMSQVKSLQITESKPGPVVAMQVEHLWVANNDAQADTYLGQIARFLRESGCNVPLTNRNNLWQPSPGTIDTWDGDEHIFTSCRQIRAINVDAPCIVAGLPTCEHDTWGDSAADRRKPAQVLRSAAGVCAAGGMFNLNPFAGGTNFGFQAGRLIGADDRYLTTDHGAHAPLDQTGKRTDKYAHLKRLCMFLNYFTPVMAHLHRDQHHTVAASGNTVVQQSGSQGSAVFIWQNEDAPDHVELTTPEGHVLNVQHDDSGVAWLVLNANLGGAGTLDLTNLRPFAFLGRRMLVLFGPAGSDALASVDGTVFSGIVPTDSQPPLVHHRRDFTTVVLNEKQVDAAYIDGDTLYVGVDGLDEDDQPRPHKDFAAYYEIVPSGKTTKHKRDTTPRRTKPKLDDWQVASVDAYIDGTAPRYATLQGPRSLEACGADLGYGWYRLRIKRSRAKNAKMIIPQAGDRLHLYHEGKLKTILGAGPSAQIDPISFNFPSGETDLVFLADNLGRFSQSLGVNDRKGLYGHLLSVKSLRLPKAKSETSPRANPFELTGYVPRCAANDRRPFPQYTFEINLSKKKTLVLALQGDRPRSVICVNNKPVAIDIASGVTRQYVLDDHLRKGKNKITFAMIDETAGRFSPAKVTTLYEVTEVLTEKADWWYARWQLPAKKEYTDLPRTTGSVPAFFKSTFEVDDSGAPLFVELSGMSKGQVFINGHNAGRYFLASHTNKKVGPHKRVYLPAPWLHTDKPNELILFDEHAKQPTKVKLTYG